MNEEQDPTELSWQHPYFTLYIAHTLTAFAIHTQASLSLLVSESTRLTTHTTHVCALRSLGSASGGMSGGSGTSGPSLCLWPRLGPVWVSLYHGSRATRRLPVSTAVDDLSMHDGRWRRALSLGAASPLAPSGASSLHIGAYSTVLLCTAFELDLVKLRPGLDKITKDHLSVA